MGRRKFRNFDHFKSEVLFDHSGPLASAVEDIADEMYNHDLSEEFDGMWDAADADEE